MSVINQMKLLKKKKVNKKVTGCGNSLSVLILSPNQKKVTVNYIKK